MLDVGNDYNGYLEATFFLPASLDIKKFIAHRSQEVSRVTSLISNVVKQLKKAIALLRSPFLLKKAIV